MGNQSINYWPDEDRPREKLLEKGAETLSTSELLAIFLRTGTRGKNAVELSRELLETLGGLRGIFSASEKDLQKVTGIGMSKAVTLKAVAELNRRFLRENLKSRDAVHSPVEVFELLSSELRDRNTEVFKVLFMNSRNEIIDDRTFSEGTVNASPVYPREIVRAALETSASSIIIVHNHPTGNPEPSTHDREITRKIQEGARLMDITLADHVIVGDNRYYSFANRGLL